MGSFIWLKRSNSPRPNKLLKLKKQKEVLEFHVNIEF